MRLVSRLIGWPIPVLCVFASATLWSLASPPHSFGIGACIALVPWLVGLNGHGWSAWLFSGFTLGGVQMATTGGWAPGSLQQLGYAPGVSMALWIAAAVLAGGVPFLAFGAACRLAMGTRRPWQGPVVALAAVAALDEVRSLDVAFLPPWMLLGHTQWDQAGVRQLAIVAGVPGISALLVAINIAAARVLVAPSELRRETRRVAAAFAGAYLALASAGLVVTEAMRPEAHGVDALALLVVQPAIPPGDVWDPELQQANLRILSDRTVHALHEAQRKPDLVAWPESAFALRPGEDAGASLMLQEAVSRTGVPVLLGITEPLGATQTGLYRSRAIQIGPDQNVRDLGDKEVGVPLVESQGGPLSNRIRRMAGAPPSPLLRLTGDASAVPRASVIAAVLCYEGLFPRVVARRRTASTVAVVNLVSDGWTKGLDAVEQQLAHATFRAVEQRVWFVRASDIGISAAFDPFGREVARLSPGARGAFLIEATRELEPTLLERGAVLILCAAGAIVLVSTSSLFGRK